MSDKIRKYVLPNLPYLFVFWFFSKIGTAYRIAPGTDFGTKLMGMLDTLYSYYESGKRDIPTDVLIRLAKLYQVSTDYLLGLTDQRQPYPAGKSRT